MAREDVVPGVFARLHAQRRSPWVGLIFAAVVVTALLVVGSLLNDSGAGVDLVARLAAVTVVLLLVVYIMVVVSALKLRGHDEDEHTFRAPTALLVGGLVGNAVLLGWVVYDDPSSLLWCGGLVAIGVVLFVLEYAFGRRDRKGGRAREDAPAET
jgi:amino acid transporter